MVNTPRAILTPKGERWLRSGHPWIFRDDVFSVDKVENGEITALYNRQKNFLGWAFYSRFSRITFRIITSQPQIIDQAYWRLTLQKAMDGRKEFMDRSQACRIVSSEADGIPGLIADWYAGHLVIQILIPGIDCILNQLNDIFHELTSSHFHLAPKRSRGQETRASFPRGSDSFRTCPGKYPDSGRPCSILGKSDGRPKNRGLFGPKRK